MRVAGDATTLGYVDEQAAGGEPEDTAKPYAVFGATGFVGRRLVRRLLGRGHRVRALVRTPAEAADLAAAGAVLIPGDVLDAAAVAQTLRGVSAAYYLVHSLGETDFAERDQRAASILAEAARDEGVAQLVFLGGLAPVPAESAAAGRRPLSAHLASRTAVADLLLGGPVPAIVLRASMIIGSGSASFELLRRMVHWAPVLPAPDWMGTRIQPIAIEDVLHYLNVCAELPAPMNASIDIGGPDVVTYSALVQRYARAARLPRRLLVPAPALFSRFAAVAFARVVAPSARVSRPLLESLTHEMTCHQDGASPLPPPPGGLTGLDAAMRAHTSAGAGDRNDGELTVTDERAAGVDVSAERLWSAILGFGGGTQPRGTLLTLVGVLDHALGGVGLHRDRPDHLVADGTAGWWRVLDCDHRRRLLLVEAELRLPGLLRLELSATEDSAAEASADTADPRATYRQVLSFRPHGLPGQLWWLAGQPVRARVLDAFAREITAAAGAEVAAGTREDGRT